MHVYKFEVMIRSVDGSYRPDDHWYGTLAGNAIADWWSKYLNPYGTVVVAAGPAPRPSPGMLPAYYVGRPALIHQLDYTNGFLDLLGYSEDKP